MATRDVSKEAPEVICELRVRAVELTVRGLTHETIANTLDISVAASRLWWRMYREDGKKWAGAGSARTTIWSLPETDPIAGKDRHKDDHH